MSKGDDDDEVRMMLHGCDFTALISNRSEEAKEIVREAGKRAWRQMVERGHRWRSRVCRLLIR